MFERKTKPPLDANDAAIDDAPGTVDGGPDEDELDVEDRDFLWEEGDPADRRKDPLRKP